MKGFCVHLQSPASTAAETLFWNKHALWEKRVGIRRFSDPPTFIQFNMGVCWSELPLKNCKVNQRHETDALVFWTLHYKQTSMEHHPPAPHSHYLTLVVFQPVLPSRTDFLTLSEQQDVKTLWREFDNVVDVGTPVGTRLFFEVRITFFEMRSEH